MARNDNIETWRHKLFDKIDRFDILAEMMPRKAKFFDDFISCEYTITLSIQNPKAEFLILHNLYDNNIDLEYIDILKLVKYAKCFTSICLETPPELILSIHRGQWKSSTRPFGLPNRFHCHLSYGPWGHPFLMMFKNVIQRTSAKEWWNNEYFDKIAKEWPICKDVFPLSASRDQIFETNVLNNVSFIFKIKEMFTVDSLVKDILSDNNNMERVVDDHLVVFYNNKPEGILVLHNNDTDCLTCEYRVVFHAYQPQIGLAFREETPWCAEEQRKMIELLELIGTRKVLLADDCAEEDKGYNICLNLLEKEWTVFERPEGFGPVRGYLQVSGKTFARLCPPENLESWFQGFRKWDGRVYT